MTRGLSLSPLHHDQWWHIPLSVVTPSKQSVPYDFMRSVARSRTLTVKALGPSRSRSLSVVTSSKPSVPHGFTHSLARSLTLTVKALSPSRSRSSSVVTQSKPSVPDAHAHGFTLLVFGPHCSNRHSSLTISHLTVSLV